MSNAIIDHFFFGAPTYTKKQKKQDKALDIAIREMEPVFAPEDFPPVAADLCQRLLDKDPTTRLGARGGAEEIMAHPWFASVDWDDVRTDKMAPPFVPARGDVNAAPQNEIGTFNNDDKAFRDVIWNEQDEKLFQDWDWTNPEAMTKEILNFLMYERELGRPLLPGSMHHHSIMCCCKFL